MNLQIKARDSEREDTGTKEDTGAKSMNSRRRTGPNPMSRDK